MCASSGGRDFTEDCSAFARDASAAARILDEGAGEGVDNESYSLWTFEVSFTKGPNKRIYHSKIFFLFLCVIMS
jgi:hypothetical protein